MLHLQSRYCPLCAEELVAAAVEGRTRAQCPACGFVLYLNPASAAAAAVLDDAGRVLLIRRRIEPFLGSWALPAGYQEIDEDPRETALREVREESGLSVEVVRLFDVLWMPDDPRRPANVIVYLCRPVSGELRPGSDASDVAWFALDRLPDPIGFRNAELILSRLPRPG